MKRLLLIFVIINFSVVHASTDANIKVHTTFNYNMYPDFSLEKDFTDLIVVKEKLNFPPANRGKNGIEQYNKLMQAYELIEIVINSSEFKKRVLSYAGYKGRCNTGSCYSGNRLWKKGPELTNAEIYDVIMKADEKMRPGTEKEVNLNLTWAKIRGKVIGRTNPSRSEMIEVNWKRYYWRYDAPEMVNNVLHEWIHLLGFLHYGTMSRNPTYVIGKIAKEMATEYLAGKIALKN